MHESIAVDTGSQRSGTAEPAGSVSPVAIERDQANVEAILRLGEAADHIRDLQLALSLWPERRDLANEHARHLWAAFGRACDAIGRSRAQQDLLIGLPACIRN